jgi:FMN phosphatase YigB (HAD superfamily)
MNWIIDFDDTLVLGPNTWAFAEVLPSFIQEHRLPYDKEHFDAVMLKAQQQANEGAGEQAMLDYVFGTLQWPASLGSQLVNRVFNEYTPHLFADTRSFLDSALAHSDTLYMVSNNNYAPTIAQNLGIADCFTAIYTPQHCQGARPKPHPDMWERLCTDYPHLEARTCCVVGDDPWSDGSFAHQCGIPCWIVDRLGRYYTLHTEMPFRWATSLAEITRPL